MLVSALRACKLFALLPIKRAVISIGAIQIGSVIFAFNYFNWKTLLKLAIKNGRTLFVYSALFELLFPCSMRMFTHYCAQANQVSALIEAPENWLIY